MLTFSSSLLNIKKAYYITSPTWTVINSSLLLNNESIVFALAIMMKLLKKMFRVTDIVKLVTRKGGLLHTTEYGFMVYT